MPLSKPCNLIIIPLLWLPLLSQNVFTASKKISDAQSKYFAYGISIMGTRPMINK